ncbi:MAG: hypothetical protein MJB14_13600 [Spirochaetes bacterium]|nr:hypothetical protein [Spirochaetota bacterium]
MKIFEKYNEQLQEYGAVSVIFPKEQLQKIEAEMTQLYKSQILDQDFYKSCLEDAFEFKKVKENPQIRSIVLSGTPSPLSKIEFDYQGIKKQLLVPPIYSDREMITARIKKITKQIFDTNGYHTFSTILPKKLIAVYTGMALYGRNNIIYVKGLGSFLRLTIFATDLPSDPIQLKDSQLMDRCQKCQSCIKLCPTQAIDKNRILLHAEKCLTFFNEGRGLFPDWIYPQFHNSLVGCIICQKYCPANKDQNKEGILKTSFTKKETDLIMTNEPFDQLPQELQKKIHDLSIHIYYDRLPRNIQALYSNLEK